MLASLDQLAALPGDTRVCCTHEYTLSNLKFARAVEPGNAALVQYISRCEALRAQGLPTLPSRIALEREINPFLRTRENAVAAAAAGFAPPTDTRDAVAVLAALREWKTSFDEVPPPCLSGGSALARAAPPRWPPPLPPTPPHPSLLPLSRPRQRRRIHPSSPWARCNPSRHPGLRAWK